MKDIRLSIQNVQNRILCGHKWVFGQMLGSSYGQMPGSSSGHQYWSDAVGGGGGGGGGGGEMKAVGID